MGNSRTHFSHGISRTDYAPVSVSCRVDTDASVILTSPSITTIDICRRASIPVIFTCHCHKSTADYGMLAEWSDGDMILDGSHKVELMPELDQRVEDEVVEKNTYSMFQGTCMEELLKERGIEEVIVTGMMTNLYCEMMACDAFVRGSRVFFSVDATATSDVELHEATLKNLAFGFAYLVDCERLQKGLFGN